MDPWQLINQFNTTQSNAAAQDRGNAMQMLLSIFGEEASRQRPYVTLPAQLAQYQGQMEIAEPFEERAAQRRYNQALAVAKANAEDNNLLGGTTTTTNPDGSNVLRVGDTEYTVDSNGNVVTRKVAG